MRRTTLAAFAAGLVLGSTGIAGAALAGSSAHGSAGYRLQPGTAYTYGAFTCTTYDAPTPALQTIVCLRNDLKGLTLAFNAAQVVGARVNPSTHKVSKIVFRVANR